MSSPLEAQQASLKAAGAERIFAEKISGAITDRKALAKALATIGSGDILLVTRLDRLARSTRDLLNVLDAVSKVGGRPFPCRCLGRHYNASWRANDNEFWRGWRHSSDI
jgi:DNA invertase Pin-like site-specific DNA recombinase